MYIPAVNLILWIACSLVVVTFRTSHHMEAAYCHRAAGRLKLFSQSLQTYDGIFFVIFHGFCSFLLLFQYLIRLGKLGRAPGDPHDMILPEPLNKTKNPARGILRLHRVASATSSLPPQRNPRGALFVS